jgi:hypothetical protein
MHDPAIWCGSLVRQQGGRVGPRGPRPKNLPALLGAVLNEPVVVTIDGERREIANREAVVTQLVNKSTGADLRATKTLIDMLKDVEKRAGANALRTCSLLEQQGLFDPAYKLREAPATSSFRASTALPSAFVEILGSSPLSRGKGWRRAPL